MFPIVKRREIETGKYTQFSKKKFHGLLNLSPRLKFIIAENR